MVRHKKKIRIIIAKVGCDIHERGALTLMHAFRNAGMEVIYTGRYQTPEGVVKTAIQEDADIIALSDSTGSMLHIATAVLEALKKEGVSDIHVVAGGLIPRRDIPILEKMGVTGNFGPGTPLEKIIDHIVRLCSF
jgi:methylmalonyl-CoA mutase C-terminal domain/subunit